MCSRTVKKGSPIQSQLDTKRSISSQQGLTKYNEKSGIIIDAPTVTPTLGSTGKNRNEKNNLQCRVSSSWGPGLELGFTSGGVQNWRQRALWEPDSRRCELWGLGGSL